ncbi:MAG TPA: hypothetical protein PLS60_09735, partial [Arenimonas sp.]|nr:hypothetical protein [Arenimonas sp.]
MSRYTKSASLLIPAVASLFTLAISTSALAQRSGPRGTADERENTVVVDDDAKDARPRHRGEQARTEQEQAVQAVREARDDLRIERPDHA